MADTLRPGDEFAPLTIAPVSRTVLALFAGASGDHNPMHIDLDTAHSAGLDDVFAHGMLSMAYLARLLTDNVSPERLRTYKARFVAITPVHGEPTCRGLVREIVEVNNELRAVIDLTVTLVDGTVTLVGEATISID